MRQRRHTWQTLFTTTALVTAAAVGLTACGGTTTEPKAAPSAAAFEGKGPINYVSNRDASGAANKSIEEWNAAHPDEKVTFIELPDSADQQRQQLIQNAQIKSDTFSVLNLDVVWTSEFAANKWIMPLPKDAVPTDTMIPATVNAATYRDSLVGAPYYTDGALFYFRQDLLTAAGIAAPPTTWDEMKAACTKILALPDAAGMSCYTGQFDKNEALTVNFAEAVASAGGTVVDADGKPTVTTAEAKEGLNLLVDGFKDGLFPSDAITYLEEQGRRAFQDGKLVFMRNWPFLHASLSATDGSSQVAGKFGITSIPGTDGRGVSTLGGRSLAISPFTPNKATALEFVKFFTSEEQAAKRLELSSRAPVYASLFEDPAVVAKRPFFPTLLESLNTAQPRPKVVQYGATTKAIQEEAYAAITGAKDTDTALNDMQAKLTELTK
ncbi:ABC transporter substrate-binding protein [Pseudarthrobacter sp. BIM B-2242]|uniref:ABC transporter substrate-binding protein n=1 Tax=Pseudarthrobacter sp. BIM B-2242 TaxID=2772401 RepID=UPI00168A9234|nr:ABC transporter substrate-binding protein [Pseudarthrobacter sp. BIM B-2242]QOD04333.1 ABC transporter substrate-binding protein [Pseudarthrobacter sp. BIM B-2242]